MTPLSTTCITLMYHNVCDSPPHGRAWPGFDGLSPSVTNYFVDRELFQQHCAVIADSRQSITFDESLIRSAHAFDKPEECLLNKKPRVLLTFDDGWRGTVEIGGPILESHDLQAMLFVTTDLIGHRHFVDRSHLQKIPSTFQIGSHAKSHRLLAELSDDEVRSELQDSKAELEDILGREVDSIAYPGGSFDRRVLRMTREAGYRWVFTSRPSVNTLPWASICIDRLAVKQRTSMETLQRWLQGDIRKERARSLGIEGAKRLLGRDGYRRLRSLLISENVTQLEMTDLVGTARLCEDHSIRERSPSAVVTSM